MAMSESKTKSDWEFVERTEDQSDGKDAYQPQSPGDLCKKRVIQNPSVHVQKTYHQL